MHAVGGSVEILLIRSVSSVLMVLIGSGCARSVPAQVEPKSAPVTPSSVASKEVAQAEAIRFALVRELEKYCLDCGRYPTTEQGLAALFVRPEEIAHWRGPYVEGHPPVLDPWGRVWQYRYEESSFTLISAGPDGVLGTFDDIGGPP